MSVESQKILEALQYISFAGIILPGLAALVIPDFRKKAICLFILFVFTTILSFVFYAGVIFLITALVFILVFILLYLLARALSGPEGPVDTWVRKRGMALKIMGTFTGAAVCAGLGYLVYDLISGYIAGVEAVQEIYIAGLEDIAGSMFSGYDIVVIFLIASSFIAFVGFTVFREGGRREGEAD